MSEGMETETLFKVSIGEKLGHYRVLEKIGMGGMGVVYRGHDERLDRDVALKVLPPGMLTDEASRKRFRKEALALSHLNHPNIATIHDFDTQGSVDFLVMEYVVGVTLEQKLAEGALPEKEVATLGGQMAEALEEAHEQSLVHRDLKPGNIMVTPKGRVKVLDFGLAKLLRPVSETATTEGVGERQAIVGTLPYMAPEQLRGEGVDVRTDLYALGAVLYEMSTGQRPFPGPAGPQLIDAILNQPPPAPSAVNCQVSSALESIILKALEKAPSRRYQSCSDLKGDLERLSGPSPLLEGPNGRPLRHWLALIGTVLVIALAGTMGYYLRVKREPQTTETPTSSGIGVIKPRRSVAVLGFKNLNGRADAAWLSTAFSEMLTTELAAGEKLRTISGENVARMKIELSLADTESFAKDTLERIRKNLSTDLVVFGSYVVLDDESGDKIRLDLRLQDAAAGETIAAVAETGTEAKLLDLISNCGARLREKLGAGDLTAAQVGGLRASFPSNTEGARLYSEGLAKLRLFDALSARDLLQKAVTADPRHALAHSALATAWSALGYDAKAREEAKKAFDLSASLTREEQVLVEGRYRETIREWEKAIELYKRLWGFFPDNLDYGVRLATTQISAGKGKDALVTIEELRKLPSPGKDDPRIDLTEVKAADSLSDFKRLQLVAMQAATRGAAQGARLLVAGARLSEGWALQNLGQPAKAAETLREAQRIYEACGDRGGVARALHNRANVLYSQGELSAARKMYEQSLVIYREIGDETGVAGALNNIANVLADQGDLMAAGAMYKEALGIERRIESKSGIAMALGNVAHVLREQGDLAGGRKKFEQSLGLYRDVGEKHSVASTLVNIADILADQGHLSEATTAYEEALAIAREIGDESQMAYALAGLGDVRATQGDLAGARQGQEEAFKVRSELGEKLMAAEDQLALAVLAIEEGRPAEAELQAREAATTFQMEKVNDSEARAQACLARSLLDCGKRTDAQMAIARATALSLKSRNAFVRLFVAITAARVRAILNKSAEATKSLKVILGETTKADLVGLQFETQLALGEIEMNSGNSAAGRSRLEALEKDAKTKGYGLIARKAATARK